GSADPTFGDQGWVQAYPSTDADVAEKVLVQPDGKIIAAGRSYDGGDWGFSVIRMNPNGSLDTSFGGNGHKIIGFGGDDKCWDAALQADGKLVLVGENDGTVDNDFAVCRLDVNGQLDHSFDGDGTLTTGFGHLDDAAFGVDIQNDGRIVV